ncbi:MAG: polyribonucleotide nucleotidyltransferase [Candidatus Babeliaceae bacterium]
MEKKFSLPEFGYEVVLGKFAGQADGAAWLQQGGTIVLATVCSAPSKEFPGFLPLTVDYRENYAAAGKIPGGYFKREGKFSDREVITGRLIDRTIRPLFPYNYFDQLQVFSTVYSVDKEHVPHTLALLASSLALTLSKIPFMGPVGVAEVVLIDGKWIVNPTYHQALASKTKIVIAGTEEGINMVEGTAAEISEKDLIDVLFLAHETIKKQVAWQKEIQSALLVEKAPITDSFDWKLWSDRVRAILSEEQVKRLFTADKVERRTNRQELESMFLTTHAAEAETIKVSETFLKYIFDVILKEEITKLIFKLNKRIDLRDFETVRPISTEVGLLPYNHGSALFTRGKTQALVSVTLGSGQDVAKIDTLMNDTIDSTFMLHYNFPAFSVGEVRPNRGPGRREIGHGYLAASAIQQVLPDKEAFGYTLRIVADILESDGSTSMATVCGSTMALMNAGVPITKMVTGVAMGLLGNEGAFKILTDIAGIEDEFGLMDFKVAGTAEGITAIQMDIKYKGGLSRSIFEIALNQAVRGRLFILNEMRKVMSAPNPKLSELVPQIVTLRVPVDKIGGIIGKEGKIIRQIIEKTSTSIDIEDDGLVKIYGHPGEKLDMAVNWIKTLGGHIERGTRYTGIVKRIADFGIFVEIAPGCDGLVHISTIARKDQEQFMKSIKIDDVVKVEVLDYEVETGRIRLKIV